MAEQGESSQERTLEPTQRRIEQAREEGRFAQSRDLATLAVVGGVTMLLLVVGRAPLDALVRLCAEGLRFGDVDALPDRIRQWAGSTLPAVAAWVAALLAVAWIASALAPLALERLQPVFAPRLQWSRLDPIAGLKRIVSVDGLVELVKAIAKAVLLLGVAGVYLVGVIGGAKGLVRQETEPAIAQTFDILSRGLVVLVVPLLAIGVADAALQWFRHRRGLRMSLEELRDEMKETEGSPHTRARIRQRQRERATSRMMAAVRQADVVVVNPTHYAVALSYDAARGGVPVVVAKGEDEVALRMREEAARASVPVAELPELARALHGGLKVGMAIPTDLYVAVARVIAWAYGMRDGGDVPLPSLDPLPRTDAASRTGAASRG